MSSVEEKASRRRCRLLPNCAHIDHSQTHLHSCRALQCGRGIILLLWLFLFFLLQKIPLNRFSFSWLRSILAYWLTSATMGDRHEVWQNLLMSLLLVYLLAYLVDFSILKKMCDNISVWSLRPLIVLFLFVYHYQKTFLVYCCLWEECIQYIQNTNSVTDVV